MRSLPSLVWFVSTTLVIVIGAGLVGLVARQLGSLPINASNVQIAPIFSEEVLFSQAPDRAVGPNAALTMLEDSGAAIANLHLKRDRFNSPQSDELVSKLRSTQSRFTGIGLEGAANVNGKPFSWANVNLSNISYG